jgi:hypothetical protein
MAHGVEDAFRASSVESRPKVGDSINSTGGDPAAPQGTTLTWSHVRPCVLLTCSTHPYGDALARTMRNSRLSVGYCGAATNPVELVSTETELPSAPGRM